MIAGLKGVIAAAFLVGSTVAATAPAQADRGTGAVIAGLFGLGIGAAIASDHHRSRYDESVEYYTPPPVAYYGGGYDDRAGYNNGAGGGYSYGYGRQYDYGYRDRGGWDRRGWQGDRHHDWDRHHDDRRSWDRDGDR